LLYLLGIPNIFLVKTVPKRADCQLSNPPKIIQIPWTFKSYELMNFPTPTPTPTPNPNKGSNSDEESPSLQIPRPSPKMEDVLKMFGTMLLPYLSEKKGFVIESL
jgi:hypothetical protein